MVCLLPLPMFIHLPISLSSHNLKQTFDFCISPVCSGDAVFSLLCCHPVLSVLPFREVICPLLCVTQLLTLFKWKPPLSLIGLHLVSSSLFPSGPRLSAFACLYWMAFHFWISCSHDLFCDMKQETKQDNVTLPFCPPPLPRSPPDGVCVEPSVRLKCSFVQPQLWRQIFFKYYN